MDDMTRTETLTGDAPEQRDLKARAVLETWTREKVEQFRDLLRESQAHLNGLTDMYYDAQVATLSWRLAELERLADKDLLRRMKPTQLRPGDKVPPEMIRDIRERSGR